MNEKPMRLARTTRFVGGLALLLAFGPVAWGQSLGEAARKEKGAAAEGGPHWARLHRRRPEGLRRGRRGRQGCGRGAGQVDRGREVLGRQGREGGGGAGWGGRGRRDLLALPREGRTGRGGGRRGQAGAGRGRGAGRGARNPPAPAGRRPDAGPAARGHGRRPSGRRGRPGRRAERPRAGEEGPGGSRGGGPPQGGPAGLAQVVSRPA